MIAEKESPDLSVGRMSKKKVSKNSNTPKSNSDKELVKLFTPSNTTPAANGGKKK